MGGGLALHYLRVRNSGMYSKLKGIFSLGSYLMKSSLVYTQRLNNNIPLLMLHGKHNSVSPKCMRRYNKMSIIMYA